MDRSELELLDSLLHKLRQDKHIMEGLSVLEQQAVVAASETISSLIRKHCKPPAPTPETEA